MHDLQLDALGIVEKEGVVVRSILRIKPGRKADRRAGMARTLAIEQVHRLTAIHTEGQVVEGAGFRRQTASPTRAGRGQMRVRSKAGLPHTAEFVFRDVIPGFAV